MKSNMNSPTLIIDSYAICHQVKYTIGDLSYEEQKVGIIFGFLRHILSLSKQFDTNKFLFCWDSKKSFRKDIYPTYKENRRKEQTPEEQQLYKIAFKQFHELRLKVLPKFGFKNNFIQTGMEADDLIAIITQNYDQELVIISADQDLYQLLSPNVSMYSSKGKKLTTEQSFTEKYDITPKEWVTVKQVAGCNTDNVKGIKGVGEKTAIKYIKNKLGKHTKTYNSIVCGDTIIERNEALVKLPFKGTKTPKIKQDRPFYLANFIELTDEYGFRSMQQIETLNSWITQFGMV